MRNQRKASRDAERDVDRQRLSISNRTSSSQGALWRRWCIVGVESSQLAILCGAHLEQPEEVRAVRLHHVSLASYATVIVLRSYCMSPVLHFAVSACRGFGVSLSLLLFLLPCRDLCVSQLSRTAVVASYNSCAGATPLLKSVTKARVEAFP